MGKNIPAPVAALICGIVAVAVIGYFAWANLKPSPQAPPTTAQNIAHGPPPAPPGMTPAAHQ